MHFSKIQLIDFVSNNTKDWYGFVKKSPFQRIQSLIHKSSISTAVPSQQIPHAMKKKAYHLFILPAVIAVFSFSTTGKKHSVNNKTTTTTIDSSLHKTTSLYDSLSLHQLGLSRKAFDIALQGYQQLLKTNKLVNTKVLSIIDMSLPSASKRLFIVDVAQKKLLFHTYVAHGRNSGLHKAQSFSNAPQSFKSSLGFFVTADTYQGKHGYSLQLNGLEKGFNDNALSRGIVMHAANYVNEHIVKSQGYLGRSLGCPAVPENLHTSIIKTIANGSCFFIYGADNHYLTHSSFVKGISS